MAQYITQHWPNGVFLRENILIMLQKAIGKRTLCHEWYLNLFDSDEDHKDSNTQHAFYIRQLQEVLNVLQGLYNSQGPQRIQVEQERLKKVHGIGDARQAQETSTAHDAPMLSENKEDVDGHGEIPVPVDYVSNKVKKDIVKNPSKTFASKGAFEDLDLLVAVDKWLKLKCELHVEVKDIWTRYEQQKIPLSVAAITTDTAIEILRQAEEEMAGTFCYDHCSYEKNIIPYIKAVGKRIAMEQRRIKSATAILDAPTLDLLNDTMIFFFKHIDMCKKLIANGKHPQRIIDHECVLMDELPSSNTENLTFIDEEYLRRKIIVASIYLTLMTLDSLSDTKIENYSPDEFTLGIRGMKQTGSIPAWLVFATEVQFDIHLILGPQKIKSCLAELQSTQRDRYNSAAGLQKVLEKLKKSDGSLNKSINKQHETLSHLKDYCTIYNPTQGSTGSDVNTIHLTLLECQPVWCGLVQFETLSISHSLGIAFDKVMDVLLPLIYLYDAIRTQTHGVEAWKDMDFLIAGHGMKYLFYGSRPSSIGDYLKRFSLSIGKSPRSSVSQPVASRRVLRLLKRRHMPLFNLLYNRYCSYHPDLSEMECSRPAFGHVDQLLSWLADPANHDRSIVMNSDGDIDMTLVTARLYPPRSPSDLLRVIQNESMRELPHLLFDYHAMLHRAYTFYDDAFHRSYTYLYPLVKFESKKRRGCSLVTQIITQWSAAEEKVSRQMKLKRTPKVIFPLLCTTQEAMKRAIAREGNAGMQAIHDVGGPALSGYEALPIPSSKTPFVGPDSSSCRWWKITCEINDLARRERTSLSPKKQFALDSVQFALDIISGKDTE